MLEQGRYFKLAVMLGFMLFASSCLEEVPIELTTPVVDVPPPVGLSILVGDGSITLSWDPHEDFDYSGFVVYRSDDDRVSWHRIATVFSPPFKEANLRNAMSYWYRVSGLNSEGLEGSPSSAVPVRISVFSVVINGGETFSKSRNATLAFYASPLTQLVSFSEDSSFSGAPWQSFTASADLELTSGDGVKVVYARFKSEFGNLTETVSDSIILDTHAAIEGLSFSPTPPLPPGSTIRFTVTTAEREPGGTVSISIDGLLDTITALDDGTGGDGQANDGVYERDYQLPRSLRGRGLGLSALFVDAAGNESGTMEFPNQLDLTDPPQPVYIFPVVDSTVSSVSIRWSEADAVHFLCYRVFRDVSAGVSEDHSQRMATITEPSSILWTDYGLGEGETYYYRVYVVNDMGESSGSNVRAAKTDDIPPDPVVCDTLSSVGTDRVTLTWTANMDTDFLEYRVYRSLGPGVTDTSATLVGGPIQDRYQTYFDDSGLDLTNNDYFYRVYVYDRGLHKSRSNEVSTKP